MIFRVTPSKDTFLTTARAAGESTPRTGSNMGAAEILAVFKEAPFSGSSGVASTASLARTILQFDLDKISELTASGRAPAEGVTYILKLSDARHVGTLPSSFDMEASMMSRSWDEGGGLDTENYSDVGFANWDKATSATSWVNPGGDFITSSLTASYHFDVGSEDAEIDVTPIVQAWLTGGFVNNGFMVKLTKNEEDDSSDYFKKLFHGKSSHYADKRPVLEARWDDSVRDDRSVFLFDFSSSLYLYNKKRGQFQDIPSVGTGSLIVSISDLSGTIMTVTGSHTGRTGIYSASFVLPTGSYSGSLFTDAWGAGGASFMTGSFTPHNDGATSANDTQHYVVKVTNLRREYGSDERVRFDLFVKTRNFNPAVVQTGSVSMKNTIIEKGYYRIDNDDTKDVVIPLGTGSVETTRLSYDENGNYFELETRTLHPREVYRVLFFFDVDGQLQRVDESFKFRVI